MLPGVADAARVQHSEPLRGYRAAAGSALKATGTQPTTLHFNAFSRDFAVELEPNGRLAGLQQQLRLGAGGGAYRGAVAGRPSSWARIVLTPAGPTGLVFDGETFYGIEAGADRSTPGANGEPIMFRLADVYFGPGEIGTELDTVTIDGEQAVAAMATEFTTLSAAGATLNLDVGAVADFEFSQRFGALAETALLTRLNNVDGIFSEQLGIQITVAETKIFTSNDDPFTTSSANALLSELASYRGATPGQDAQGLTHLFTGRDLDGSTAGIAYFGSVCAQRRRFDSRSFGAGLSEARRGAVTDSLVAAHEIGHNFGAPHDGAADGACASTPTTFLMAPSVNDSRQFSACSIAEMQAEIAAASCLTPIGAANVAVTFAQPVDALAGVAFELAATARNDGVEAANGVSFAATAEQGLEIVAIDAGDASCTIAALAASCALGTVGGGASRSLTLTLRAQSAGAFNLTGAVAADADAKASDDSATVTLTAIPSVDLVLSGAASEVQLNAPTTINALLENTADVGATAIAVTASLTAGLRADHATLDGAVCTVTAQAITCPTRALQAQSSVTLAVAATGVATGSQQVSIGVSANEAERTPADNQLALGVTVNAPQERSDGGGGGAMTWWVVVALLAARGLRYVGFGGRRRPS